MKLKSWPVALSNAWVLAFGLIPLAMMLVLSFLSQNNNGVVRLPLTLENYLSLLSPDVAWVFLRSLVLAMITCALCLLLAYPFSYCLVRSKHQSLLVLLIMIPFWTSSLVRTYALLSILKANGLINTALLRLHWIDQPLNLLYNNVAVIGGLVYNLFPFMVLPLFNSMGRFDFVLHSQRPWGRAFDDVG